MSGLSGASKVECPQNLVESAYNMRISGRSSNNQVTKIQENCG